MGYGKKLRVEEGDILAIPIRVKERGLYAFCRVISYEPSVGGAFLVEVFNYMSSSSSDCVQAVAERKRLFPPIFAAMVFVGDQIPWKIVFTDDKFDKTAVGYDDIEIAFPRSAPPEIWCKGKTRPVTSKSELEGIERSIIWTPIQIEQRVIAKVDPEAAAPWLKASGIQ